jgi:hypothetical protein
MGAKGNNMQRNERSEELVWISNGRVQSMNVIEMICHLVAGEEYGLWCTVYGELQYIQVMYRGDGGLWWMGPTGGVEFLSFDTWASRGDTVQVCVSEGKTEFCSMMNEAIARKGE